MGEGLSWYRQKERRCKEKKEDCRVHETLYTDVVVATKQKSRAETRHRHARGDGEKKPAENRYTKTTHRDMREKKRWSHRATGKQKRKWL